MSLLNTQQTFLMNSSKELLSQDTTVFSAIQGQIHVDIVAHLARHRRRHHRPGVAAPPPCPALQTRLCRTLAAVTPGSSAQNPSGSGTQPGDTKTVSGLHSQNSMGKRDYYQEYKICVCSSIINMSAYKEEGQLHLLYF